MEFRLGQVAPPAGEAFEYLYDPGDGWEHTVVVEQAMDTDKRHPGHPVCLDGARACPPEECGGPGGYEGFLAAIANPKHKRHREMRDWIGGDFDPAHFDPEEINDILKELSD